MINNLSIYIILIFKLFNYNKRVSGFGAPQKILKDLNLMMINMNTKMKKN